MDSPITRAFGLPELALHLEQFLFPRDIACLMQTCGTLYSTFLPRYAQKSQDFSALCLFHDKPQAPRSLRDVAINAFHLRTIMIDERSCRKYHDEFRDVYFPISPSPTSSSSSSPSSSSASPPDPPSPYQIPAQPSIESLCENRDLSVQVWCFLQGSPRLTTLHMHNIKIDDSFKAVWAATISKLKILETLYLDFVSMSESSILHAIRTIFAKRPTSLKSVTLRLHYASDLYVLCSRVDPAIDDPFLNTLPSDVIPLPKSGSDEQSTIQAQ
ncbi:hypothetical protein BG015_011551 [Linnemannia schmuckeri]|uniref:Uncharacterized protein n=1 Tax=Linnemannia schmuckeri TaxID=64567 RepID=A0A9P5RSX2_9FUNG|nr:hypothetical protein BG015_011551 [Linnemannia schmuckeri]